MDHAYVNRFSLAALGSVLFVMLLVAFSNLVISPKTPAVPGYALPTSGAATAPAAENKAPPEEPLPALLPKPTRKRASRTPKSARPAIISRRAQAQDRPAAMGRRRPPIASVPGFAYSDSIKGVGGDWSYEALNKMIGDRKRMASGTKMAFPGEKAPHKRADILAYLQTLFESPVPFPK